MPSFIAMTVSLAQHHEASGGGGGAAQRWPSSAAPTVGKAAIRNRAQPIGISVTVSAG